MTRTITAHMFSSINGVSESPDRFQFDAFGEAEGEMMGETLANVTDVIMGRTLWQEWESARSPAAVESASTAARSVTPVLPCWCETARHPRPSGWARGVTAMCASVQLAWAAI